MWHSTPAWFCRSLWGVWHLARSKAWGFFKKRSPLGSRALCLRRFLSCADMQCLLRGIFCYCCCCSEPFVCPSGRRSWWLEPARWWLWRWPNRGPFTTAWLRCSTSRLPWCSGVRGVRLQPLSHTPWLWVCEVDLLLTVCVHTQNQMYCHKQIFYSEFIYK